MNAEAAPPSATKPAGVVQVRIPARQEFVPTVQVVITELAGRADFDLDAITQLSTAIATTCSRLIQLAPEDGTLTCTFTLYVDRLAVAVHTCAREPVPPVGPDDPDWRTINALTDRATLETDGDASVRIRFDKRLP